MKYDIAAKKLLETGKEEILELFFGIQSESIHIIDELPTESASLRNADFALKIKERGRLEYVLFLELQTEWQNDKILSMVEYAVRYTRRFPGLEIRPCMALLTPSSKAIDFLKNSYLTFRFHLVKMWELNPQDYENAGPEIQSLLPLMKSGTLYVEVAEKRIYENRDISRERKGDLLTALAIFTGLKDGNLTKALLNRRRDIMIESAFYEIVKEEGIREGELKGKEEGVREGERKGKEEGIREGKLETARRMREEGMEPALIQKITGLTPAELRAAGVFS